jgi:branched-subunit amino acid aminotransferase/4-amino-4-deoxychorismate lyase
MLYISDEVFLTGTAAEVTPVVLIDQDYGWRRSKRK